MLTRFTSLETSSQEGFVPFNEKEKNLYSFKGVNGIFNASSLNPLSGEQFAKGFSVYPSDIIAESSTIIENPQSTTISQNSNRIWQSTNNITLSETESIMLGQFQNLNIGGSNTNVEFIRCILTKVGGTSRQLYAVYNNEDANNLNDFENSGDNIDYPNIHELSSETLKLNQSKILKNFISPQRFGAAYGVQIFESNDDFTGPSSVPIGQSETKNQNPNQSKKQHGGWVFDYKEGFLLFGVGGKGVQEDGSPREPGQIPNLSGYRHPLWIKGYRYKGKTGSAGATTEITNETTVEAEFDTNTFVLTVGGATVNLAGLGQTFEQLEFEKDFSRDNNRCSSSIAIMYDADADGFPYTTSSYESWILLNGIHVSDHNITDYRSEDPQDQFKDGSPLTQFPYGYAIGFSSSLNVPTSSQFLPHKGYTPIKPLTSSEANPPTEFEPVGVKSHRPHGHGFNWGYITSSGENNYHYNPSGQTSGAIANGLRDLINTYHNAHFSASVELSTVNGQELVPLLTVEQVYTGFPTWYYTNLVGGNYTHKSNIGNGAMQGGGSHYSNATRYKAGVPGDITSQYSSNDYIIPYVNQYRNEERLRNTDSLPSLDYLFTLADADLLNLVGPDPVDLEVPYFKTEISESSDYVLSKNIPFTTNEGFKNRITVLTSSKYGELPAYRVVTKPQSTQSFNNYASKFLTSSLGEGFSGWGVTIFPLRITSSNSNQHIVDISPSLPNYSNPNQLKVRSEHLFINEQNRTFTLAISNSKQGDRSYTDFGGDLEDYSARNRTYSNYLNYHVMASIGYKDDFVAPGEGSDGSKRTLYNQPNIQNNYTFHQNTPLTGSNGYDATLEFQKVLFHIDEKSNTGSNFFNSNIGSFQNLYIGDLPDCFTPITTDDSTDLNLYAFVPPLRNYINEMRGNLNLEDPITKPLQKGHFFSLFTVSDNDLDPNKTLANRANQVIVQNLYWNYLPGSIVNNFNKVIDVKDNGYMPLFKAGARSAHPNPYWSSGISNFGDGNSAASPKLPQNIYASWGMDYMAMMYPFYYNNTAISTPNGGFNFPMNFPTASDSRFGGVNNNNSLKIQPNPSKRSIIKKYTDALLLGGYQGVEFGLRNIGIDDNENAVLQLSTGIRSLQGNAIFESTELNYPNNNNGSEFNPIEYSKIRSLVSGDNIQLSNGQGTTLNLNPTLLKEKYPNLNVNPLFDESPLSNFSLLKSYFDSLNLNQNQLHLLQSRITNDAPSSVYWFFNRSLLTNGDLDEKDIIGSDMNAIPLYFNNDPNKIPQAAIDRYYYDSRGHFRYRERVKYFYSSSQGHPVGSDYMLVRPPFPLLSDDTSISFEESLSNKPNAVMGKYCFSNDYPLKNGVPQTDPVSASVISYTSTEDLQDPNYGIIVNNLPFDFITGTERALSFEGTSINAHSIKVEGFHNNTSYNLIPNSVSDDRRQTLLAYKKLIQFKWTDIVDYQTADLIWNKAKFDDLDYTSGSQFRNVKHEFKNWEEMQSAGVSGSVGLSIGDYIRVNVALTPREINPSYLDGNGNEDFSTKKKSFYCKISNISTDKYTASLQSIDTSKFSNDLGLNGSLLSTNSQLKGTDEHFNISLEYDVNFIRPLRFVKGAHSSETYMQLKGGTNFVTHQFIDLPPYAGDFDFSNQAKTSPSRRALNPFLLTQNLIEERVIEDEEGNDIIQEIQTTLGKNMVGQGVIKGGLLTGQANVAISSIDIQSDDSPSLGGTLDINGQLIEGIGNINLIGNITSNNIISPQGNFTDITTSGIDITDSLSFRGFTFEDSQILSHTGSNIFGSSSLNTHQFTGSVFISGSKLKITGSLEAQNITGSLLGTSSFAFTSSLSYNLLGSPDLLVSNITASNISASGIIIASASIPVHNDNIFAVVYDTGSGEFHYTGSYGRGGGAGTGFPFSGSADLTGSLTISSSSPFIQIDSSSISFKAGKLHNRGGALYWGDVKIASGSPIGADISNIVEDSTPQLGGNLDMQSNSILGGPTSRIILSSISNKYLSASSDEIEIFGDITQLGDNNSTLLQNTKINKSLEVVNSITSSIISSSGTIVASNLSGTNTGDQDLSSYSTIVQLNDLSSTLQTNIDTKASIVQLNASSSTLQTNIDNKQDALTFGVSDTNIFKADSGIVDNDFLRVNGTVVEGRSASQVLSDIGGQASIGNEDLSIIQTDGLQDALNSKASTTDLNNLDSTLQSNLNASSSTLQNNLNASSSTLQTNIDTKLNVALTSSFQLSSISSSFIDASKILVSNSISIGTPYTPATLNVSGNIFISNTNDVSTPHNEGILMESTGENDETINKIFFQRKAPIGSSNGIEFIHNGSTNTLNNLNAGTFSITHHDNSVNGISKFSIKSNGNIGIGKSSPNYGVHIGPETYFDNNVEIASGRSIQMGSGVFLNSSFMAVSTIVGANNSNIGIGKIGSSQDAHVRNSLIVTRSLAVLGDIIVGGTIKAKQGQHLSLGDPHRPIKSLHIDRGTIFFYSGSTEDSSSLEKAKMSVNEDTGEIEFKSGSEFTKVRASEINLGNSDTFNGVGSVQIGQSDQGFIAVNAEPGKSSTVLRAESSVLTGDFRMGSITQKGSGSFAILLDADQVRGDAKFVIESNQAVPSAGPRLFSVSESMETRVHNGGLRADNYITTTNITASGNISASGVIISNNTDIYNSLKIGTSQNTGSLIIGPLSNKIEIKGGNPLEGTNPQIISSTGVIDVEDNVIVSGDISASNNLYSKRAYFYDDESAYLGSGTNPILHLKNTNVGDNADSYIKFESTDNGSHYSVGIDTNRNTFVIGSGSYLTQDVSPPFSIKDDKIAINVVTGIPSYTLDVGGDIRSTGTLRVDVIQPQTYGPFGTPTPYNSLTLSSSITASGHIQFAGNISGSHVTTASFGSLQLSNLPTTPTGLPTGSVWVSGSKNDVSTNNVNCGTLMIVI